MSAANQSTHRIQHGTQHSNPRAIDDTNIWRRPLLSLLNPPITAGFLLFCWGPFFQIFERFLWGQSWSVFCPVLFMILFLIVSWLIYCFDVSNPTFTMNIGRRWMEWLYHWWRVSCWPLLLPIVQACSWCNPVQSWDYSSHQELIFQSRLLCTIRW